MKVATGIGAFVTPDNSRLPAHNKSDVPFELGSLGVRLLGKEVPNLVLGEQLEFKVIERSAAGYLLDFQGTRLSAESPMDLAPGNILLARVIRAQDDIILETLSLKDPPQVLSKASHSTPAPKAPPPDPLFPFSARSLDIGPFAQARTLVADTLPPSPMGERPLEQSNPYNDKGSGEQNGLENGTIQYSNRVGPSRSNSSPQSPLLDFPQNLLPNTLDKGAETGVVTLKRQPATPLPRPYALTETRLEPNSFPKELGSLTTPNAAGKSAADAISSAGDRSPPAGDLGLLEFRLLDTRKLNLPLGSQIELKVIGKTASGYLLETQGLRVIVESLLELPPGSTLVARLVRNQNEFVFETLSLQPENIQAGKAAPASITESRPEPYPFARIPLASSLDPPHNSSSLSKLSSQDEAAATPSPNIKHSGIPVNPEMSPFRFGSTAEELRPFDPAEFRLKQSSFPTESVAQLRFPSASSGPSLFLNRSSSLSPTNLQLDIFSLGGRRLNLSAGEVVSAKVIGVSAETTILEINGSRLLIPSSLKLNPGDSLPLLATFQQNDLFLEVLVPWSEVQAQTSGETLSGTPFPSVPKSPSPFLNQGPTLSPAELPGTFPPIAIGRLSFISPPQILPGSGALPAALPSGIIAFSAGAAVHSFSPGESLTIQIVAVQPEETTISIKGTPIQLKMPPTFEAGTQFQIRISQLFPQAIFEILTSPIQLPYTPSLGTQAQVPQTIGPVSGSTPNSLTPPIFSNTALFPLPAGDSRPLPYDLRIPTPNPDLPVTFDSPPWKSARILNGLPVGIAAGQEFNAKVVDVQLGTAFLQIGDKVLVVEISGLKTGQNVRVQLDSSAPSAVLKLEMPKSSDFGGLKSSPYIVTRAFPEQTAVMEIGQTLTATVYRSSQPGRFLLEFKGNLHEVQSTEPLLPGSEVELRLESHLGRNSIFRLVRQSLSMEELAESILNTRLPASPSPTQSFADLRTEMTLATRALQHDVQIVRQLGKLESLISQFLPPDGIPKAEHLDTFVRNGGIHFEAKLARAVGRPEDFQKLFDSDLKGQLVQTLQALQQSSQQVSLQKLTSAVQQYLNLIETQQLSNYLAQARGNALHLDIPFLTGAQMQVMHLAIQPDPSSGREHTSPKRPPQGHKVLFLLDLDHFGQTRIDSYITPRSVDAILYIENRDAIKHLRPRLGEFQRRLHDLGYANAHLEVRHLSVTNPEKRQRSNSLTNTPEIESFDSKHLFKQRI